MSFEIPFSPFTFILLVAWDLIWRGIALWTAARREERNWFVALLIINSIGLLPIIYLGIRGRLGELFGLSRERAAGAAPNKERSDS